MEDWIKERADEIPSSEGPTKPVFTIFGWDLYIISFAAIGGAFVLFGLYWIFFSGLPMPRYCHAGYRNASLCGWMDRSGRPTSAPWADRPRGPPPLDRPPPPS